MWPSASSRGVRCAKIDTRIRHGPETYTTIKQSLYSEVAAAAVGSNRKAWCLVGREVFEAVSTLPQSASDVYAWHLRPGALERLLPPWQDVRVVSADHPLREGARVVLRMGVGPVSLDWTAVHHDFTPGRSFVDVQESGPFAQWRHEHRAEALQPEGARLVDHIEWALPGGAVGHALGASRVRHDLETMFAWRHRRTLDDLERHAEFAPLGPRRVLVTGASGSIGRAFVAYLGGGGHEVIQLVRRAVRDPATERSWRPDEGTLAPGALDGIDVVVHLAGESVAGGRWSPARKARILESRVRGTETLARAIAALPGRKPTFVCASAIGFYGSRRDEPLDETSSPGDGFLARVVQAWEGAAEAARGAGARTVNLRFGVVLDPRDGALAKMLPAFRFGVGGRIASGQQHLAWVDLDDAVGALERACFDERLVGPVNVVAPGCVTQAEFAATLARVLGRPLGPPLPAFVVEALFGEMGRETLLSSALVQPSRLRALGHRFVAPSLEDALRWQLGRTRGPSTRTRLVHAHG